MKVAKFEFSLFGINTYVCVDEATKKCAVIDPGMSVPEEEEAMVNFIERNGLELSHIINTHLHIDHSIGNAFMVRKYGVPVLAAVEDEPLGNGIKEQAMMFGIGRDVENVKVDKYIKEGDVIKIGEGELEALHVPGHSPGSIVLYDKKDGFLFGGDVLFAGSIGRTDLMGGNHSQLISGIKGKLLTLPPSTVVFPGHGEATTIGDEAKRNPFLR